jgi:hypothetical protein
MQIEKSLAEINDRLAKAQDDLRIAEEQLLFQMDLLEETKTRAVVAETPLAHREQQEAEADYERMVRQRDEAARQISSLKSEQDRLLDRMLGT